MFELNDNNEWKPSTEAIVRKEAKSVYGDVDSFIEMVKDFNGMGVHLKGNCKVRFTA